MIGKPKPRKEAMYPPLIQLLTSRDRFDHIERELVARAERAERRAARISAFRTRLRLP